MKTLCTLKFTGFNILTQDLSFEWIDQFLTVSDIPPTMHQSLDLMQKENWVSPLLPHSIFIIVITGNCANNCGFF